MCWVSKVIAMVRGFPSTNTRQWFLIHWRPSSIHRLTIIHNHVGEWGAGGSGILERPVQQLATVPAAEPLRGGGQHFSRAQQSTAVADAADGAPDGCTAGHAAPRF